ncbi:MAG: SAVED domain-containing protein [Prevotella sp.]
MSRTPIPLKVKALLWYKAAGRCEFNGCNKRLDRHGVTMDKCNLSNCAHIIADSPDGPRGNEQSKELAKDESNIMLMCPECHKYIDHEGKDKFDAHTLREMKKRHEERMEYLTSFNEDMQANVVTYGANIADLMPMFNFHEIQKALSPDFYPLNKEFIELGVNLFCGDDWENYWKKEDDNLVYSCKTKVLERLDRWEHKRIALFGFAPMPLLVRLGTLLNNKLDVVVYQKQRCGGWQWPEYDSKIKYIIKKSDCTSKPPILVLSLSFPIRERVQQERPGRSIWEITIETPTPDFLRSRSILYDFGREVENVLDEITKCSNGQPIDLYLSAPVACAIEFGRVWMKKANSPLNIYDFDRRFKNEDRLAITINNL